MQSLWLISILLFVTFSEGRRGKRIQRQKRLMRAKKTRLSLYSRIKKDLNGVEGRIQRELKEMVDTVTELKNITEGALLVDSQEIGEVEPELDENDGIPGRIETCTFQFPSTHTQPFPMGISHVVACCRNFTNMNIQKSRYVDKFG